MLRFLLTICFLLGGFNLCQEANGESAEEILESVKDSWRKRSEKCSAVQVSWRQKVRIFKGAIMSPEFAAESGLSGIAVSEGVPTEDVDFEFKARLLMQEDWMRYETKLIGVNNDYTLSLQEYISSFDGDSSRLLTMGHNGKSNSGSIRTERYNSDAPSYPLVPITLFLRPLSSTFSRALDIKKLQLIKSDSTEQNLIHLRSKNGIIINDAWNSRQLGGVITHWEQSVKSRGTPSGARRVLSAVIEYAEHPLLGHVPSSWYVLEFSSSSSQAVKRYEADEVKIEVIKRMPKSVFSLEFPDGTEVYDHLEDKSFFVGTDPANPLVAPDAKQSQSYFRLAVIVINVVCLLLFAFWVYRHRCEIKK